MKIAYLILAHQNPQLLKRTVKALSSEECAFFIHIDKKSEITEFLKINGRNVFFVEERLPVYWGEFSLVQAELLLMRHAFQAVERYDYFVLIGGSDYPLRSGAYVHRFLEENRGYEFINLVKVPAPGKPISRINTIRLPSTQPVRRFIFRVLAKMSLARRDLRKHLGSLEPYSGSQWWALSREACSYIFEFLETNHGFIKFFEHVFAADEAFFHTILGNSAFKPRIRRNLLYDDWSAMAPHPAVINEQHLKLFEAQEKVSLQDIYGNGELLFARKFSDKRLDLVDQLDAIIQRKEAQQFDSKANVCLASSNYDASSQ